MRPLMSWCVVSSVRIDYVAMPIDDIIGVEKLILIPTSSILW